jgi:hypothetical protein
VVTAGAATARERTASHEAAARAHVPPFSDRWRILARLFAATITHIDHQGPGILAPRLGIHPLAPSLEAARLGIDIG